MNNSGLQICGVITVLSAIVFGWIVPGYFSWSNIGLGLGISGMYCFFNAYSQYFLNCFLDHRWDWVQQTQKRLLYGIPITIVVSVVVILLCNYLNFVIIQGVKPEDFFSSKYGLINWFFVNFVLLISAVMYARSFMLAWKAETRNKVWEQKVIATSANAQFESLKNQLDPHFLFNSLNTLSALIGENPKNAEHFTNQLSQIYRYILEMKDKELVSLEEEVNFAQTYIQLLKYRFEESIIYNIQIQEEDRLSFVVPLSLQLLLENCIKHNLATDTKPLQINIYTENNFLIVENNLQKREQALSSSGIGLSNIANRYQLVTDRKVLMIQDEEKFKISLPLLTKKIEKMKTNPYSEDSLVYQKAVKRVKEIKDFYSNLISYCCVIPFLIAINLLFSPGFYWFMFPMLGWGLGVAIHGFSTFGIGKNWEEKKIRKLMKKGENSQKWQ
ncbi:2TM domain-containing protein [Elizabethkingia sp. JS20170427COW]|uniref:2TM domain-containing protein n=1 Tax=Elizabethkingia sp. JS20170427COW TaxID=2583851 RepID=UPI00110FFCB8|nr:2TM domain-containing protein [Elizabethkingia sp. JS20170427COW]QCX53180.1 histidine kinase [Elizabethkingia sp. JS20170427COW]